MHDNQSMKTQDFTHNLKIKYQAINRWQKAMVWLCLLTTLIILLLISLYFAVTLELVDDIPSKAELTRTNAPIASTLKDQRGNILGKYYIENRSPVSIEEINDFYINALLATEDHRFYNHRGVDTKSILRVFFKTLLLQKDASGGGSTITQQLAKNLFPRKNYPIFSTLINKFREMEMARRLEDIYSKEEIIARYSNTVSYGERAFGIQTAAHRFFNKTPKNLLVEEAATLVGMLKATSYYNPRNYPERAADRRNVVLAQMVKHDFIASSTYEELKRLPVRLDYQPPSSAGESARYFKEYIRKEFNDWTLTTSKSDGSKYDLFKDGLTIVSTLDLDLQNAAESIMEGHMKQLQKIFLESWIGGKIYGSNTKVIDDYITNDKYYKALRNQGASGNEALQHFTKHQSRKLWTWSGMETKSATKIDSIKHYLTLLHTGILAAHPESGAIKVWVGGNDFSRFQYDNITGARQVGSTFKPIVYLAGIQSGLEPCDVFDNDLRTYAQYDDWTPKNSNGQYGGKVTLKGALTHSINTISVQVLFSAGIENVVRLAQQLGVTSKLNKVPSLVLGTSDVSILEMVQVYATLANRGTRANLYGIHQILDQKGNVLFDRTLQNGENLLVADPEAVDILNEMMLNVSVEGTGRRIYQNYRIPYPISGKTGTTQNQSDGWYIGANPDLVIGSWVGTQDRRIHFRNLGTGSGGATALPMVGSLFEYAARNRYLQKKKIPMSHLADCPDYLLDEETIRDEMTNLIESIDDIKKDIMGDYFNLPRRPTSDKKNRINTRKRNQERDKRFKSYKKAVKQLEKQLEDLKDKLDELEEG